jgi:hypothetical protein
VLVILVLSTIHIVSMIGNLVSQRDIILRDGGVVSDRNVTAKSRGKLATYFIIHSKQPTQALHTFFGTGGNQRINQTLICSGKESQ